MAVYNSHNTKQWEELLNAINGGDTSAIATALGLIKTSIDSINTSLGSLSVGVEQDTTQWVNLINAITNQSLNVDLSNITSSVVNNLSDISGSTTTDALNTLNSITEAIITPLSAYGEIFIYNKVYKKAGIVYIFLEIADPSNVNPKITTYNADVKIGSLPIGYIPNHRMYVSFNILNDSNASYLGSGSLLIDSAGDVKINIPRKCNFSSIQVAYPL